MPKSAVIGAKNKMYSIKVTRKKPINKRASLVLKKDNIGMQQMFDELCRIITLPDFKDCKVFISSTRNSWREKRQNEYLPFE